MVREPASVARLRRDLPRRIFVRAGNPVLLDDEPARVAVQLLEETLEVDVTGAELAEDAGTPGRVPAGRAPQHVESYILDVEVIDAAAPVSEALQGIAACRNEMTGVEEQCDVRP